MRLFALRPTFWQSVRKFGQRKRCCPQGLPKILKFRLYNFMETKADYSWQVTAINFFLLATAAVIVSGINNHYDITKLADPFGTLAGLITGNFFMSAIVASVLYLISRNKQQFRIRRCLILSAWVIIFFQLYPIISPSNSRNESHQIGFNNDFAQGFKKSFFENCYQTQRANSLNNGAPDRFISDYCECTGRQVYNDLTYEELMRIGTTLAKGEPPTQNIQEKLNHAARICMEQLVNKMSPSELKKMDSLRQYTK